MEVALLLFFRVNVGQTSDVVPTLTTHESQNFFAISRESQTTQFRPAGGKESGEKKNSLFRERWGSKGEGTLHHRSRNKEGERGRGGRGRGEVEQGGGE